MTKASIMAKRVPFDTWLLLIVLALAGLGSVVLYSNSFAIAETEYKDPYYFFNGHMFNLKVALLAMLLLSQAPYQLLLKLGPVIAAAVVVMLLLVLHPAFAREAKGAARWLRGVPIQPSETAKLAVVILMAGYYARIGRLRWKFGWGFLVPCLLVFLYGGLIAKQKDLGGPLVILGVVALMMVASGVRWRHLACLSVFAVPVWLLISYFEHRLDRVVAWNDPWGHASNEAFSIIQSFYAFGSGGIWGVGIGQGMQKLFFMPLPHSDYIFSGLAEELGLVGVVATVLLFFLLALRGFSIAAAARDKGGYYLAAGATLTILVPMMINVMVALSIIPAKGLPLPFVSYGGTSLVVSMSAVGILLNISGQTLKAQAGSDLIVKPYGEKG
jgi:cell division protein FtsW